MKCKTSAILNNMPLLRASQAPFSSIFMLEMQRPCINRLVIILCSRRLEFHPACNPFEESAFSRE
jgi:hypothetical protein